MGSRSRGRGAGAIKPVICDCATLRHASRRRAVAIIRVASIRRVVPTLGDRALGQAGLALGQGIALRVLPNARGIRSRRISIVAGLIRIVTAGALSAEIWTNAQSTTIREPV
jgi:hypothetical protein